MTDNMNKPQTMVEFTANEETEDRELIEKIRPLPADVVPSEQFVLQTRAHLLAVMAGANQQAA